MSKKNDYDQRLMHTLSRYGKLKLSSGDNGTLPSNTNQLSPNRTENITISQNDEQKFLRNSINVNNNGRQTRIVLNEEGNINGIQRDYENVRFPNSQQVNGKEEVDSSNEQINHSKEAFDPSFPSPIRYIDSSTNSSSTILDAPLNFQSFSDAIVPTLKFGNVRSLINSEENIDDLFSDLEGSRFNRLKFKSIFNNEDNFDPDEHISIYNLNRYSTPGSIWKWFGLKFGKKIDRKNRNFESIPFFTYWLITIETIILANLLFTYGFNKFLFEEGKISKFVLHQTNSYQNATYYEHPNIWWGPTYADLIREGAKFTPCMTKVRSIMRSVENRKLIENESGCCIRSDLSGCVQTIQSSCSNLTSFWIKWDDKPGPVCGLDPKYCLQPVRKDFPTNITDWPICRLQDYNGLFRSTDFHMKCSVKSHPCCIGIYGKCIMASKEYCEFIKGKHHPEASLCSQINCMEDVCGVMLYPYQFHRLFLSLFIHAGVIQFLINIFVQYVYMRRLEQLLGKWRIMVLFFVSGFGGNLASAVFLPIVPDAGPNAALFGLISFLFWEMCRQWQYYQSPKVVIAKVGVILIILLLPGLFLPFVDIYSIIFGIIYGLLTLILIYPRSQLPTKGIIISTMFLLIMTAIGLLLILKNDLIDNFMDDFVKYTNQFNCISNSWLKINCSNIDIALKEIKALN